MDSHIQKNETRPLLTLLTKKQLKWIIDLNICLETIKLLKESRGIEMLAVVSFDPLYFSVVCCDLSIFVSNFVN